MQLHAFNQQHINSLVTALNLGQQREERRDIGIEKKILQMIHPSYFSDRIHGVHYKQIKSLFSRREECLGHKRGIFWGTLTDCTQSKGLRIITVGKSWYGHFTLLNIWTGQQWQKCKPYGRNYFALLTWLMRCFTHHMNNKVKVLHYTKCIPLMKQIILFKGDFHVSYL